MKILVGIPCVSGYGHTKAAIDSVLNQSDVELLVIDNGAEQVLKDLFKTYPNIKIISNKENIYVNPAWNQILKYFIEQSDAEHLVIMNSDLTLQPQWAEVLRRRFSSINNETLIPVLINDCKKIIEKVNTSDLSYNEVGCAAGVFITLNKVQAKLVYPVTEDCKIWFGDNWIYDILSGFGYKMVIPNNLLAFHSLSQTIQTVPNAHKIIGEDQKVWFEKVEQEIKQKIKQLKGG